MDNHVHPRNSFFIPMKKIIKGFEYHTVDYAYYAIYDRYAGKRNVYRLIQENIETGILDVIGREIPLKMCREMVLLRGSKIKS
jgi:hypothetical protein